MKKSGVCTGCARGVQGVCTARGLHGGCTAGCTAGARGLHGGGMGAALGAVHLGAAADLRGDERRGHELLAQAQLPHVGDGELLLGRVEGAVPHVVVDGRELDSVARLAQVAALDHVVDRLGERGVGVRGLREV